LPGRDSRQSIQTASRDTCAIHCSRTGFSRNWVSEADQGGLRGSVSLVLPDFEFVTSHSFVDYGLIDWRQVTCNRMPTFLFNICSCENDGFLRPAQSRLRSDARLAIEWRAQEALLLRSAVITGCCSKPLHLSGSGSGQVDPCRPKST